MDKTLLKQGRLEVMTSRVRQAISSWQLYALILPEIGFAIAFHYLPMYGIIIAFKDFRDSKGIWGSSWVGITLPTLLQLSGFLEDHNEY